MKLLAAQSFTDFSRRFFASVSSNAQASLAQKSCRRALHARRSYIYGRAGRIRDEAKRLPHCYSRALGNSRVQILGGAGRIRKETAHAPHRGNGLGLSLLFGRWLCHSSRPLCSRFAAGSCSACAGIFALFFF